VACAALVGDGGIYRHEFVAQAVVSGLMEVPFEIGVQVLSVLPQHFQSSLKQVNFFQTHFIEKKRKAACAIVILDGMKV
jgi:6,7-dimethyl-8-ribityllumazine synthase